MFTSCLFTNTVIYPLPLHDALPISVNNLSAARSRIEDADYAVEVSNMTRAQILQQAGTSVLAQANQVPQTVRSEEHTSELQSRGHLVCRLLLDKKKYIMNII